MTGRALRSFSLPRRPNRINSSKNIAENVIFGWSHDTRGRGHFRMGVSYTGNTLEYSQNTLGAFARTSQQYTSLRFVTHFVTSFFTHGRTNSLEMLQ